MSTSEQLDEALNRLRAQGHTVQTNPGVYAGNDGIHITIDGQLRSVPEIYEMLSTPDDVFGFKVGGKVCEVHIYYVPGDISYEVHQDGKRLGDRQRLPDNEDVLSFVQRIAKTMGATTLPEKL